MKRDRTDQPSYAAYTIHREGGTGDAGSHDKAPDTRKAWDKLYSRLRDEQLIPARPDAAKKWISHTMVRMAAALLILAGIGAMIYLNRSRKPAEEMVQLNTGNDPNTLIKTLADGSVIYIARNSMFSFPAEFGSGSRHVELKGEAFFDIATNPDKPFVIETERAFIEVLGTAFNVSTQMDHDFKLFVDRGRVKVTLKSDPSHCEMVLAGEKISNVQNILVKSKQISGEASSWYKQRMHFKDETLRNIISILNRNFNTTFVLADHETGEHKLTATFCNDNPETMTGLICATLNLKSQTIHGAVVFSENKEGAKPK